MANKEILNLEFESADLGRIVTIKEFFIELLTKLFEEGEDFNGKRPFGNSGWDYDLCVCLAKNGVIKGECDNSYGLEDWIYDSKEAATKISELVKSL